MQGLTILDALNKLYQTHGQFLSKVQSVELTGADAMEKAAKIMSDFRMTPPTAIGDAEVTVIRDYKTSRELTLATGEETVIPLPSSNVLEFILGDRGNVIVRPSGTEPKVKFYYTAVADTRENAQTLLANMMKQLS